MMSVNTTLISRQVTTGKWNVEFLPRITMSPGKRPSRIGSTVINRPMTTNISPRLSACGPYLYSRRKQVWRPVLQRVRAAAMGADEDLENPMCDQLMQRQQLAIRCRNGLRIMRVHRTAAGF